LPEKVTKLANEKLKLVDMEKEGHKMPSELSGGMKKRVGLARAIALEPQIILYDEPTTGLDPIMTGAINKLILDMQDKLDITSVVISHDIKSAFEIADNMAMIDEGRVVEFAPPEEFRRSKNAMVQSFIQRA
jgi:phospholipid/cholesterol/gamma-HCH transport system ATP-binding protein